MSIDAIAVSPEKLRKLLDVVIAAKILVKGLEYPSRIERDLIDAIVELDKE